MNPQKNRLALAGVALVALIGVAVWFTQAQSEQFAPSEKDDNAPALPKLDKAKIDQLIVHKPGEAAPTKIEKRADGWWVTAPQDGVADAYAVDLALDKLDELKAARVAASNSKNHERLEVSDGKGLRVEVRQEGKATADLIIGAFSDGATMVRPHGEDIVFASRGSFKFAFDKAAHEWRNTRIVDEKVDELAALSFHSPRGDFDFARGADGEWQQVNGTQVEDPQIKGMVFRPSRVDSAASTLARFRATNFAKAELSLAEAGLNEASQPATVTMIVRRKVGVGDEAGETDDAVKPEEGPEDKPSRPDTEAPGAETEEVDEAAEAEADTATFEEETIVLKLGAELGESQERYAQRVGDDTIFIVSRYMADVISVDASRFRDRPDGSGEGDGAANPVRPSLESAVPQAVMDRIRAERNKAP